MNTCGCPSPQKSSLSQTQPHPTSELSLHEHTLVYPSTRVRLFWAKFFHVLTKKKKNGASPPYLGPPPPRPRSSRGSRCWCRSCCWVGCCHRDWRRRRHSAAARRRAGLRRHRKHRRSARSPPPPVKAKLPIAFKAHKSHHHTRQDRGGGGGSSLPHAHTDVPCTKEVFACACLLYLPQRHSYLRSTEKQEEGIQNSHNHTDLPHLRVSMVACFFYRTGRIFNGFDCVSRRKVSITNLHVRPLLRGKNEL